MLRRPRSREGPGPMPAEPDALLRDLARDPPQAADVVTVETDVGPMLLHASDEVMTPIIAASKTWEAAEGAGLRGVLARGQTVVDVGANVGCFTVLAARAVGPSGRVVAVEPERERRTLRARPSAQVMVELWLDGIDERGIDPADVLADYRALGRPIADARRRRGRVARPTTKPSSTPRRRATDAS